MTDCDHKINDWVRNPRETLGNQFGQIRSRRGTANGILLKVRVASGERDVWRCEDVRSADAPEGLFPLTSKAAIKRLQRALRDNHFDPGNIDGAFGFGSEAALIAYQRSERLDATGLLDMATAARLGLVSNRSEDNRDYWDDYHPGIVAQMLRGAPMSNIKAHLPVVANAMRDRGMQRKSMVLMALATIRAESAGFAPINEFKSRFNTSPNAEHDFDLYDHRADIGNRGPRDGADFRGRGFIQLTGRHNYDTFGRELGVNLIAIPERANDPDIAAALLAAFIKRKEQQIEQALLHRNLRQARRLVNGGSHGLDNFVEAFEIGHSLVS